MKSSARFYLPDDAAKGRRPRGRDDTGRVRYKSWSFEQVLLSGDAAQISIVVVAGRKLEPIWDDGEETEVLYWVYRNAEWFLVPTSQVIDKWFRDYEEHSVVVPLALEK